MTKKEIVNNIKKMDNAKVINLWNNYVGEKCYPHENDIIYTNNCAIFNSFFTPYDAVMSVLYGNYNEEDDYVIIDEHENVQSFTDWDDIHSPVDIDALVNWLIEKEGLKSEID